MLTENESNDAFNALLNVSSKIDFFKNLSENDIKALISDVKINKYKYGEVIFHESDSGNDNLYYLIKGKISISKYMQGTTSIKTMVTVIDKPSLFGEMRRFTYKPRSATVTSLDNQTLVVEFKLKDFNEATALAKFYRNVICELSEKINKMNDQYC
ncbi:MAG: cyclic nucleotide-binding domain-containing protein [Thiovulaceae bacterium]|nr:cyclic nucleotide-binding domain-containing protein [Sulfurimonadaceae bacterium]